MGTSQIEALEGENRALRAELTDVRRHCTMLDLTLGDIRASLDVLERHADTLQSLFVASTRLHGSDLDETLRTISDILRDLVGAQRYAVYLLDESDRLVPIIADEMDETPKAPLPDAAALASVDLELGGRKVGLVEVVELFPQKGAALSELDHQLLEMLGRQAAPALVGTRMAADLETRAAMLRELVRFLGGRGSEAGR